MYGTETQCLLKYVVKVQTYNKFKCFTKRVQTDSLTTEQLCNIYVFLWIGKKITND